MAAWGGWWLKVSEGRSGWQCPQQLEVTAQVRVAHPATPQTQKPLRAQGPGQAAPGSWPCLGLAL